MFIIDKMNNMDQVMYCTFIIHGSRKLRKIVLLVLLCSRYYTFRYVLIRYKVYNFQTKAIMNQLKIEKI